MTAAARAALAYWALVFGLGFVLGTIRVVWANSLLGESGAVLAELPVMLGASWLVARKLVRRFRITTAGPAITMGAMAFALLMVSEALLVVTVLRESLAGWLASFTRAPGALGLAGQVAFGLLPLLAVRNSG